MKLKTIVSALVAAAATAAFTPAFADINLGNDAELVFIAYDANGSYVKDLGVTIDQLLTNTVSFSQSVGAGYANMSTSSRWLLLAVDADGIGDPGEFRIVSTGTNNVQPDYSTANNLFDDVGFLSQQLGAMNQTGNHLQVANGESYNPKGTVAYYDDGILNGASTRTTNLIGVSSSLWFATNTTYDSSDQTAMTKLAGMASFNGSTISYTVSAVPEPETLALLLAGLGAVGFMARRRQA